MFQSLIAVIVALAIAITGFVKPACANSSDLPSFISVNSPYAIVVDSENDSAASIRYAIQEATEHLVDTVSKGLVETAEYAVGGYAACYILDSIATLFFPPAAAVAAFCPVAGGAGAVFGETKAVSKAL
jgi:hypothetical protein